MGCRSRVENNWTWTNEGDSMIDCSKGSESAASGKRMEVYEALKMQLSLSSGRNKRNMQDSCISTEADGRKKMGLPLNERDLHQQENPGREAAVPIMSDQW